MTSKWSSNYRLKSFRWRNLRTLWCHKRKKWVIIVCLAREVQDLKSAIDDQTRNYRDLQVCFSKSLTILSFNLRITNCKYSKNTLPGSKWESAHWQQGLQIHAGDHRWNQQFRYLHHVHHHQGQVHHLPLLSWSQFFVTRRRKTRKLAKRWRQSIGCVKKFRLDSNVDVRDKRTYNEEIYADFLFLVL